ncbi:membrane-associated HD superfamily phosphohydrolase [Pedobacter cryoconitis]|uniref:Membrane-associated HD superfamily phosphohydrolase n=1 Tax=Pedobacter cryoconitis TaxID=188932 RepID=A0A7W8ZJK9_9SPHI|nr:hypothetical protein [Pedobacter cryoconitis]MBB5635236.1 membrane-associated HD superfamily phosphohydrolase [Pedobacter cryoconitis]
MYLSGDYFFILILGAGAAGILLLGLILSITVFFTNKTAVEIIAWICGGLSLIIYLTALHLGLYKDFKWSELYFIAVLLTFFLLLQHQLKSAQSNKLRLVLIFRTVLILITFATLCKAVINLLINSQLLAPGANNLVSTFYRVQSVLFWCIMIASSIWALHKIKPPLLKNEIFKTALLFTWPAFFLAVTLGMLLFFIEYTNMNSGVTVSILFNQKFLLNQLGFLFFGCTISSIIASSIYYYYKTAMDKTSTTSSLK